METLYTVKNHYNIDTVTGINVRQFVMKCNNVLTTENRADNCLEVTAVNFDPCSSVVDSTSCIIQLSAFEPPVSRHPTSVNTSYSSLMSVEVAPPQCRHQKGKEEEIVEFCASSFPSIKKKL